MANGRVTRFYDAHAASYDSGMGSIERHILGEHRVWAATSVAGRVLEVGVGTGLNLAHYGPDVQVLGIDLSERMLDRARARALTSAVVAAVSLGVADAQDLPLADGCMDAAVSTYTMCTVPDHEAAVREAFRVLRPGGRFVLVEHGPGSHRAVRAVQRLLDPLAVRWQSDHLLRDPVPALLCAGFQVDSTERGGWGGVVVKVVCGRPA